MSRTGSTGSTLVTIGQAATALGCSYRHARRLVAEGKLAAENIGDTKRGPTWRISRAELERYVRARSRS
jgi:excisionase family DNA binding protein